ncbi:hypothetical protein GWK47_003691 [Chionoecetes opilio]|uniref:Uncharacterized protein n=1 Tax=Chionoecetes opilio TaxID=41210 RepID=A0A8J4Z0I3_CHIOP|nr:hypothetical protein GWK47_003691 [Chionoecetes opilio]
MTHPTADHLHPPAYPAQLASALLTSLQHATSSARLFLSGCFQCEFLKTGCWRGQEEQEGTWFDCDKLQVEHPYCYVNPMAVAEANPVAAPSHPPLSQSTALPHKPHPGSPLKATPLRSPGSAFANRGFGTHFADNFPKRLKELHTNGGLISENESQHGQDDGAEEGALFRDRVNLIDGEVRIARGQEGRTPLVESFAAKLEADLRRIEYDRQRAGGEVLKGVSVSNEDDPLQEQRSSEGRVDAVVLSNTSSTFPLEGSEDSSSIQTDVWKKPSVLEDVFECNNMAVFYSYGATFPVCNFPPPSPIPSSYLLIPVTEKFASKGRGEKFEEVYPVSHHNNNNNNIKHEKLSARRLVEGVAAGEIKAENNQWQNFCNEEQEMKETIFSKMFHDLISDTANVFKELVAKKLAMSHSLED